MYVHNHEFKTGELRLGNIITYFKLGGKDSLKERTGFVTSIDLGRHAIKVDNSRLWHSFHWEGGYKTVRPIELTKQRLKEFGFKEDKNQNETWSRLNSDQYVIQCKFNYLDHHSFCLCHVALGQLVSINFVHELQNVYLDFMGVDLRETRSEKYKIIPLTKKEMNPPKKRLK